MVAVCFCSVVDACHSGTVMDLPFLSKGKNRQGAWAWEDQRRRVHKGTAGGECICFSGCDDDQTSADTSSLSNATVGALTFAFIQAIEEHIKMGQQASYNGIMESIAKTLGPKTTGGSSSSGDVLGDLFSSFLGIPTSQPTTVGGYSQVPQISASEPFDMTRLFNIM